MRDAAAEVWIRVWVGWRMAREVAEFLASERTTPSASAPHRKRKGSDDAEPPPPRTALVNLCRRMIARLADRPNWPLGHIASS